MLCYYLFKIMCIIQPIVTIEHVAKACMFFIIIDWFCLFVDGTNLNVCIVNRIINIIFIPKQKSSESK